MSIIENIERVGNFTSSNIYKLMKDGRAKGSLGAPALTYIEERNMERVHGRSLGRDSSARPLSWGKLCELHVQETELLENWIECSGRKYKMTPDITSVHPHIDFWTGSMDGVRYDDEGTIVAVMDLKCPLELKSFSGLVDPFYMDGLEGKELMDAVRKNHKDGEKYYWQLVSNCAIGGIDKAELIIYCPYQRELDDIRKTVENIDGPDQNNYAWVNWAQDIELPYLVEGRTYKNLTTLSFDVPQEDIDALEARVLLCGAMLREREEI